jgi:hypothetical protein
MQLLISAAELATVLAINTCHLPSDDAKVVVHCPIRLQYLGEAAGDPAVFLAEAE